MNTLQFDSVDYADRLVRAGLDREIAAAHAQALGDFMKSVLMPLRDIVQSQEQMALALKACSGELAELLSAHHGRMREELSAGLKAMYETLSFKIDIARKDLSGNMDLTRTSHASQIALVTHDIDRLRVREDRLQKLGAKLQVLVQENSVSLYSLKQRLVSLDFLIQSSSDTTNFYVERLLKNMAYAANREPLPSWPAMLSDILSPLVGGLIIAILINLLIAILHR